MKQFYKDTIEAFAKDKPALEKRIKTIETDIRYISTVWASVNNDFACHIATYDQQDKVWELEFGEKGKEVLIINL